MKTKFILITLFLSFLIINPLNSQWQQTGMTTGNVTSLDGNNTRLFAANTLLSYSTDNGLSWINTGVSAVQICMSAEYVFATRNSQPYVYRTTDYGLNWTQTSVSAADGLRSLASAGFYIFAGTQNYGVRRSTNMGDNWLVVPQSLGIVQTLHAGSYIYAGVQNYALYRSTNFGESWTQMPLPSNQVNTITSFGPIVYAGTQTNGVYVSTNNGESWNQTALTGQTIKSLEVMEDNVIAATSTGGVYVSNNLGASWVQRNDGLPNLHMGPLLVNGSFLYAGVESAGLWRRWLHEIVLGVQNISTEVPAEYNLSQNYPNPFNPATKIKFSIPKSGHVSLNVYNVKGQLVQNIISKDLSAGIYEADFDGTNISSGIYFYTLTSGDFTQTKKMILIK